MHQGRRGFPSFEKYHISRYFSVTRPLSYRARRTTKIAALMIVSAWGLSTVIWVPTINAWPYIEGKPNLDKDTVGFSYLEKWLWGDVTCRRCALSNLLKQTNSCQSSAVWWPSTFQYQSCPVFTSGRLQKKLPQNVLSTWIDSIMARVWWETVKRQRDLVHLQVLNRKFGEFRWRLRILSSYLKPFKIWRNVSSPGGEEGV